MPTIKPISPRVCLVTWNRGRTRTLTSPQVFAMARQGDISAIGALSAAILDSPHTADVDTSFGTHNWMKTPLGATASSTHRHTHTLSHCFSRLQAHKRRGIIARALSSTMWNEKSLHDVRARLDGQSELDFRLAEFHDLWVDRDFGHSDVYCEHTLVRQSAVPASSSARVVPPPLLRQLEFPVNQLDGRGFWSRRSL